MVMSNVSLASEESLEVKSCQTQRMSSGPAGDWREISSSTLTQPVRILHLTLSFQPGGRREAILNLARAQRRRGIVPDLCCLDDLGNSPDTYRELFGSVLALERRSAVDWSAVQKVIAHCRQHRIDVMHSHDAASQLTSAIAKALLPGVSAVTTFHRTLDVDTRTKLDCLRNSIAGLFCSAVITGSKERQGYYRSSTLIPSRKVHRIPFGVDVDRFRFDAAARVQSRQEWGVSDDAIVFGAVGHFGKVKGIDVAIGAFEKFMRRIERPDGAKLVVLGSGSPAEVEAVHSIARRLPAESVLFLGHRKDVDRQMSGFDVMIHAPRNEAFGLVMIEGMATGLPIIATSVGGIPDLVRDDFDGVLAPSEDAAALASQMLRLAGDRDLRSRLGANARDAARSRFSMEQYERSHWRLYQSVSRRLRRNQHELLSSNIGGST
jgi:glycosyltransferase involved in cell wall biosynthesis